MLLNVLNKNRRVSNKSGNDKRKARNSERIASTHIHPYTPPTSTHILPHSPTYTAHIRSLYTDKNRPRTVPGRVLGCAGFARVGSGALFYSKRHQTSPLSQDSALCSCVARSITASRLPCTVLWFDPCGFELPTSRVGQSDLTS